MGRRPKIKKIKWSIDFIGYRYNSIVLVIIFIFFTALVVAFRVFSSRYGFLLKLY